MDDTLLDIHTSVLNGMGARPRPFLKVALALSDDEVADGDLSEENLCRRLAEDELTGGALSAVWAKALTVWDFAEGPVWASGTAPRTDDRRAVIYGCLEFGEEVRKALDLATPVSKVPGHITIAREHVPWYTAERAAARTFYWTAYETKLRKKGWSEAAVAGLHEASHAVVERLTDPEQADLRQAKGLVVGYVQSGKTANFTGVTAKALDAGYRLVIVLGGTLNLLRAQTQRRLDMELIGQENILRGADPSDLDSLVGIDYVGDDEEWDEFVSHGARPSALQSFDIERLTTRDKDYMSLAAGIRALEFEKHTPTQPLYSPVNLHRAAARVMVVKKNKSVLTKLVKDLKQVHGILGELPALIIDDESDQASVNTSDPKKWQTDAAERTAINGLISQLLSLLPRAQYVGYTATPFANVFVDPADAEDVFPADFLISLPRPDGYMGAQDFHDFGAAPELQVATPANSREEAHVRSVDSTTGDRMQEAMDAFVLSGALKLFRADQGVPQKPFRHHTMLVHQSVRTDDHATLALHINTMWHQAGYTSPSGHQRLEALWNADYSRVSGSLAEGLPVPGSYEELRSYVSRARQLISRGGDPVIVVNGNSDRYFQQLDLDFDRAPHIWKILVGGTKLSRGFTVEGLTVTYYRRTSRQADTLMQMGRWFGFRPGYRDLVRLYIGREETLTKTASADLYEAFEAVCRDEELFRQQLSQYAELVDGKPQLTPAQVPPLVAQHLSWLRPTARNKMFNAELVEIRSPGKPIELLSYPTDHAVVKRNTERWEPVLRKLVPNTSQFASPASSDGSAGSTFSALTATVGHAELLSVLSHLEWDRKGIFSPHLRYLAQLDGTLATVAEWLVIVPQLSQAGRTEASVSGSPSLTLVRRTRQAGRNAFSRIASVEHRAAAQWLIDSAAEETSSSALGAETGVVLLYPVVEANRGADLATVAGVSRGKADPSKVTMAFTLIPPKSATDSSRRLVRFQAKDSSDKEAAIVTALTQQ